MAGMIITGLLLGLVLGFVFQRGRFCVTGAFRDLFTIRSTRWLTAFMVIVAVQSVGVFALDALGVITLEAETFPWLGTIIGGLIFGFSIVLAGGCATGTYYRAGEGLVGSWFALIFYIVGATAFRKGPLTIAAGTAAFFALTIPWWGRSLLSQPDVPALAARVVEDGFGIAAVALVVILAWLPAADRRATDI